MGARNHQEIERKFLITNRPPDLRRASRSRIEQGYLPIHLEDFEVRLRKRDNKHFLTLKQGHGRSRTEFQVPLSRAQFQKLWPLTKDRRLKKTRYVIKNGKFRIELDEFAPPRKGLRTAEVEFRSVQESQQFSPPDWFGQEITGLKKYSNRSLAERNH